MLSVIQWKFANQKNVNESWRRIIFHQPSLTVLQVKRKIVEQVHTPPDKAFDLQLTNLETGEEYRNNNRMIQSKSILEVKLVPTTASRAKIILQRERDPNIVNVAAKDESKRDTRDEAVIALEEAVGPTVFGNKMAEEARASKEQEKQERDLAKIMEMQMKYAADEQRFKEGQREKNRRFGGNSMGGYHRRGGYGNRSGGNHSGHGGGMGSSNAGNSRTMGPPRRDYRCHRCGEPGHWIQHCPKNNDPAFAGKKFQYTTAHSGSSSGGGGSSANASSHSRSGITPTNAAVPSAVNASVPTSSSHAIGAGHPPNMIKLAIPGYGFQFVPFEIAKALNSEQLVNWYRAEKGIVAPVMGVGSNSTPSLLHRGVLHCHC